MNDDIDKRLDAKLTEAIMETIWITKIDDRVRKYVHPKWFNANGQTFTFGVDIERIKQILKDTSRSGNNYGNFNGHLQTGQEWLNKFKEELQKDGIHLQDIGSTTWDSGDTMRAARRASGISEDV